MGLLDFFGEEHAKAYNQVNVAPDERDEPKPKLSHELVAAAASYEGAKAYENHLKTIGNPTSHAKAKEIIAGAAGAFVDRLVETKRFDRSEAQGAKHHAQQQAEAALANSGQYY